MAGVQGPYPGQPQNQPPGFGPPGAPQPPYGGPPQPPYGGGPQPPFGGGPGGPQPPFGGPQPPYGGPPKKGGSTLLIAVAAFVALAAIIGGTIFVTSRGDDETADDDRDRDRDTTTTEDEETTTTDEEETTTTEEETTTTDTTGTSTCDDPILGGPCAYDDYEFVFSDTGGLSVEMPVEWSDRNLAGVVLAGTDVDGIQAATDLEAFRSNFTTSGAEVVILPGPSDLATEAAGFADSCEGSAGETDYTSDTGFTGTFDIFTGCTGGDGVTTEGHILQAVLSDDLGNVVYVNVNMQNDADYEAADILMNSVLVA